ncbi:MAG TPA: hypothetical protein PKY58_04910 [Syntrophales bacterium]|nr:hypothetical protein [Syntrophales bacterium]HQN77981.1 hypothetical protein [Syntrophales bacterium]HQQ26847.1 hypothetical protein [Syntrophales bacterium]
MAIQGKTKQGKIGRESETGNNGDMVEMEAVRKAFDEIDEKLGPSFEAVKSMAGIMNLMVYSLNQVWKEADNDVSGCISGLGIEYVGALGEKLTDGIMKGIQSTYEILYGLTKTGPDQGESRGGVKAEGRA